MTTLLDLPEDLVEEIRRRASREGRRLDEAVTDLLRRALAGPANLPADAAMLEARRQIAEKFLSGEWGTELAGFEAAREADRERVNARDGAWRE
jgi:plasmid stability protein